MLGVSVGVLAGIPALLGILSGNSWKTGSDSQNDYSAGLYGGNDGPHNQPPKLTGPINDVRVTRG